MKCLRNTLNQKIEELSLAINNLSLLVKVLNFILLTYKQDKIRFHSIIFVIKMHFIKITIKQIYKIEHKMIRKVF